MAQDTKIDGILADEEIERKIGNDDELRAKVRRAAELLQKNPNAVNAVRSVIEPLRRNQLTIFLSYKIADAGIAKQLVRTLRLPAGEKLNIKYAEEFQYGDKWREEIEKSITEANWFVLLLPSPSADWDWCLFEAGQFRGNMLAGDKLICLHHPDTPRPEQITEFQAVEGKQSPVENFLRQLFVEPNTIPGMPAINPYAEPEISKIATTICESLTALAGDTFARSIVFGRYVTIQSDAPGEMKGPGDLEDAKLIDTNISRDQFQGMFDILERPGTWGELVGPLVEAQPEGQWLDELTKAISSAAVNRGFNRVQSTFSGIRDKEKYMPVLQRMERRRGDSADSFEIVFREISPSTP